MHSGVESLSKDLIFSNPSNAGTLLKGPLKKGKISSKQSGTLFFLKRSLVLLEPSTCERMIESVMGKPVGLIPIPIGLFSEKSLP